MSRAVDAYMGSCGLLSCGLLSVAFCPCGLLSWSRVSEILQIFVLMTDLAHPYSTLILGVPVGPDHPCWGQPEHKP